jgi:hypothetical protein
VPFPRLGRGYPQAAPAAPRPGGAPEDPPSYGGGHLLGSVGGWLRYRLRLDPRG